MMDLPNNLNEDVASAVTTNEDHGDDDDSSRNISSGSLSFASSILSVLGRRSFWKKYVLSLFVTLWMGMILALVMEIILPEEGQWAGLESHDCEEYCENSHMCDHTMEKRPTVQQPVNAYSNMAYIWTGFVPIIFLRVDFSTGVYFLASTLMGLSSFMFHASISTFWMQMDGSNLYTYVTVLMSQGLHSIFDFSWWWMGPVNLVLLITMPFFRPFLPIPREVISRFQFISVVFIAMVLTLARLYKIINLGIAKGKRRNCLSWLLGLISFGKV